MMGSDFRLPLVSWNPQSDPVNYEHFFAAIDVSRFQKHIDLPARHNNILDLMFSKGCSP